MRPYALRSSYRLPGDEPQSYTHEAHVGLSPDGVAARMADFAGTGDVFDCKCSVFLILCENDEERTFFQNWLPGSQTEPEPIRASKRRGIDSTVIPIMAQVPELGVLFIY